MSMMPNIPSDYLLGAGDGLPSSCNQHWDTPLLGRALLDRKALPRLTNVYARR